MSSSIKQKIHSVLPRSPTSISYTIDDFIVPSMRFLVVSSTHGPVQPGSWFCCTDKYDLFTTLASAIQHALTLADKTVLKLAKMSTKCSIHRLPCTPPNGSVFYDVQVRSLLDPRDVIQRIYVHGLVIAGLTTS